MIFKLKFPKVPKDVIVFPYPFTGKIGFWMLDLVFFVMDFAYRRANVFVDHLAVECFFLPGGI